MRKWATVEPTIVFSARLFNPNDGHMGSTLFGGARSADSVETAAPPLIEIDRGTDGRVSGCV
jgi:hypothetical protein